MLHVIDPQGTYTVSVENLVSSDGLTLSVPDGTSWRIKAGALLFKMPLDAITKEGLEFNLTHKPTKDKGDINLYIRLRKWTLANAENPDCPFNLYLMFVRDNINEYRGTTRLALFDPSNIKKNWKFGALHEWLIVEKGAFDSSDRILFRDAINLAEAY